ncbi:uncharacterized protein LOC123720121 isoform X1 [Pieris brassicae]|uniref:Uncharacterized protein n=1 Tax=Pieris brassicae TaxID=7116 RepID=A0A9P0XHA1_PIEBR|nr:uncharacterized protein LOC123720121 isoform X1 [Pieris brassicae]CAH4034905.1 unnamed protein product [Pieris brassicae]
MDLIKITLFLAWVALSQGDEERFFSHHKPKRDCFCLPPSPVHASKITDLLHPPPGSEEVRKVVYVFKNSVTGEHKIYIPNLAKQRVFPNIAYDANEILRSIDDMPIFNDDSWVTVKTTPPIKQKHIHYEPEKPIHQDNSKNLNINIINELKKDKKDLVDLHRPREMKILGTLPGKTLRDEFAKKELYPSSNIHVKKLNKFYPTWLNKGNSIRFKPEQLQKFPYNVKIILRINGKKDIRNGQLEINENIGEIVVYTPKHTVNELYPKFDVNSNISFDEWLNIMVKALHNQLNFSSKVLDINVLQIFITNVIQNIKISPNQKGGSYGNIINFSNINLRPILIGESALINKVINNGLLKIPSGIVFLEAIFVSDNNIQSLGIIPIGHLLIDKKEQISKTRTVQIMKSITTCENDVCKTKKICKNEQDEEEPCKELSNVISKEAERSGHHSGCKHSVCKQKKCKYNKHCKEHVSGGNLIANEEVEPYIIIDTNGNVISSAIDDSLQTDEEPGIRIVGGNAATNSGTPVNIKGRSGD